MQNPNITYRITLSDPVIKLYDHRYSVFSEYLFYSRIINYLFSLKYFLCVLGGLSSCNIMMFFVGVYVSAKNLELFLFHKVFTICLNVFLIFYITILSSKIHVSIMRRMLRSFEFYYIIFCTLVFVSFSIIQEIYTNTRNNFFNVYNIIIIYVFYLIYAFFSTVTDTMPTISVYYKLSMLLGMLIINVGYLYIQIFEKKSDINLQLFCESKLICMSFQKIRLQFLLNMSYYFCKYFVFLIKSIYQNCVDEYSYLRMCVIKSNLLITYNNTDSSVVHIEPIIVSPRKRNKSRKNNFYGRSMALHGIELENKFIFERNVSKPWREKSSILSLESYYEEIQSIFVRSRLLTEIDETDISKTYNPVKNSFSIIEKGKLQLFIGIILLTDVFFFISFDPNLSNTNYYTIILYIILMSIILITLVCSFDVFLIKRLFVTFDFWFFVYNLVLYIVFNLIVIHYSGSEFDINKRIQYLLIEFSLCIFLFLGICIDSLLISKRFFIIYVTCLLSMLFKMLYNVVFYNPTYSFCFFENSCFKTTEIHISFLISFFCFNLRFLIKLLFGNDSALLLVSAIEYKIADEVVLEDNSFINSSITQPVIIVGNNEN